MLQTTSHHVREVIAFGSFRLFPSERLLENGGKPVKLGSRAFDTLLVLVERAGEVIGNDELIAKVWPGVFIEEVSLRVNIAAVRKVLHTGEAGPPFLTNVPGRGYCFVAPTVRGTVETAAPFAEAPVVAAYALPPQLSRMVGRDDAVREICRKVTAERVVSIVGPGGMGKTTVALFAAHALLDEFRGAVCFVELGALSDPRLLADTIVSAFGLPIKSQDPIPELVARLGGRRTLLILDSSEHLISEVALLTERLYGDAPDLHILITSREILRVADEHIYRLSPLECPPDRTALTTAEILDFPAARLFMDRAATSGWPLAPDGADAPIVGDICRKLGGMALAIELAAGRVGTYGLRETAALLDSQFALRWPGRRTAPARHQTLSATLDWSYNLLSEAERAVLRRLSVFVGGFTFEGAQQIAGGGDLAQEAVLDAVAGLVAKSLASAGGAGVTGRYRLLDTTRTYAAMKLHDTGEREAVRRRHAHYYRNLLQQATAMGAGAMPQAGEIDNIRAALHWAFAPGGDEALGVDLAAFSASFWLGNALFAECRDWMTKASAVMSGDRAPTQQQAMIQLAMMSCGVFIDGITDDFRATWASTLVLAASLRDAASQMTACLGLWGEAVRAPAYSDALVFAQKWADVAKAAPDPGAVAMADWMLGTTERHMGRLAQARLHLQRSLDTDDENSRSTQLKQIGYDRRIDAMAEMSALLWAQGFPDQAQRCGARAIEDALKLGYALPVGAAMTWSGWNKYLSDTDIEAVEHDIVELVEHARTHSIGANEGFGLCVLGLCQARRGEFDAAARLTDEGLRLLDQARYGVFHPIVRAHLCEAALAASRSDDALALMALIEHDDRNREHWAAPEILRVKGAFTLVVDGDSAAAADLFSRSMTLAREQGALAWELRSATRLGRLWRTQARERDALDLLAPLVARFSEGFGTADLIAAQRLIDELMSMLRVPREPT